MTFNSDDFEGDETDNPLRDLTPNELFSRAREFAKLVGRKPHDGPFVGWLKNLGRRLHLSDALDSLDGFDEDGEDEFDISLITLFQKAALIAQHPLKLEALGLTKYEEVSIKRAREVRFWNQPKPLRITIVTLCFSAIIQGWIQSGANGANQNWPSDFGLVNDDGSWKQSHDKWIFAGVNAITFLAAGIFGCWLSDPLQSMVLGRRGGIFVAGLLCFASLIGSACTRNWKELMLCRALVGLGMGAKAAVTPILAAETSPSHLRGALVMNWQLFDAFGIFLGFTANLILFNADMTLSWRLQYASACIPTACLLTLVWTIPESPRWLLKQQRHQEAFAALRALRGTDLQAATELFYANAQLQMEAKFQSRKRKDSEIEHKTRDFEHTERVDTYAALNRFQETAARTNYFSRILQLFDEPRTRRATTAASVVMIGQQLCGINVIIFYSSTFFRDAQGVVPPSSQGEAGSRALQAVWLSWGIGLANFLFTFPAYFLIDRKGRRFLLFWTYPFMTLSLLAACLSFLHKEGLNVKLPIFTFVFVFFYSWGQGPVAFAYSSEVFPLINREAGMSFAVFVNLVGAGILTLLVPLAQTTEVNILAIFVGFCVLSMVLIFFLVPETAGATIRKREEDDHLTHVRLEELNYIFDVSIRKHISYQVRYMLPQASKTIRWWLCRWFTERYSKPSPPRKMWMWVEEMKGKEGDSEELRHIEAIETPGMKRMSRVAQGKEIIQPGLNASGMDDRRQRQSDQNVSLNTTGREEAGRINTMVVRPPNRTTARVQDILDDDNDGEQ